MPCSYCGSKKHKVCTDKVHPKSEKHISLPNGDIYVYGGEKELKEIPELIVNALNATPTIPIKDLSRIISESRKNILKHSAFDTNDRFITELCFKELRDKLELRKRGRK